MTMTETIFRAREDEITLTASSVTSLASTPVNVQRSLPAETAARSLASLLSLPPEIPYALRDDGSAVYLDPERPIGDQLETGAHVTVTPKTHLG